MPDLPAASGGGPRGLLPTRPGGGGLFDIFPGGGGLFDILPGGGGLPDTFPGGGAGDFRGVDWDLLPTLPDGGFGGPLPDLPAAGGGGPRGLLPAPREGAFGAEDFTTFVSNTDGAEKPAAAASSTAFKCTYSPNDGASLPSYRMSLRVSMSNSWHLTQRSIR